MPPGMSQPGMPPQGGRPPPPRGYERGMRGSDGPPPGGQRGGGQEPPLQSPNLDRHAIAYLEDLRSKRRSGDRGNNMDNERGADNRFSETSRDSSFGMNSANGNPTGNSARNVEAGGNLADLASGVRTPMDKYTSTNRDYKDKRVGYGAGDRKPGRIPSNPYGDAPGAPGQVVGDLRSSRNSEYPPNRPPRRDPRDNRLPPELQDMEREIALEVREDVQREMDYEIQQLEDEVQRLRTENDMLRRTAKDMSKNWSELSNRLYDVDESLKKVAEVFPSEEELESLDWLLKRKDEEDKNGQTSRASSPP